MSKQKHFYLIRGLIREAEHWGNFPDHLKSQFPGAGLTAIDIPGAGEFCSSPSPLSIEEMVEEMHQRYLERKQEGEEAILVSVSLGGMIASAWMKKYPGDFARAVLINTSFGGLSPLHHRLRLPAFLYLLKVPFLKGREKEAHILRLVSNNESAFDQTLELWARICEERPVTLSNTFRQLIAGARYRVRDFRPAIPVLLLAGTCDRMVSVSCSRAIAKAWDLPLVEHHRGGHDLTADEPHWVAKEIRSWVKD